MRVYSESCIVPKNDDTKKLLKKIYETEKAAKERMPEEEYNKWIVHFHSFVRELFKLPNQLFAVGYSKKEDKVRIILFDTEIGGNHKVFFDKESHRFYIEMEE